MYRPYTTIVLLLCVMALSCHKTVIKAPPPSPTQVFVHSGVSGQLKYTLFSQPASGVKVMAYETKILYYDYPGHPHYTSLAIDSTITDSSGYFSMFFYADSFQCQYFLYIPPYYTLYTSLPFPAGDTTVLPTTWLLKSLELTLHLVIKNNFMPPLYIMWRPDDTTEDLIRFWPDSTRMYTAGYVTDSVGHIYFGYRNGTEFRRRTDSFPLHDIHDTATREFVVDPTTF